MSVWPFDAVEQMMSETPVAATGQEGQDPHSEASDAAAPLAVSDAELPPSHHNLISEDDYEAIAAAVMETERGRWFLEEYARRNRHSNTQTVLDAVGRLEERIGTAPQKTDDTSVALLSHNVIDLAEAITNVKREVQELGAQGETQDNFVTATNELEAIVTQTEAATGEILEAAEKIQEVLWVLREEEASSTQCDIIESKIIDIYTACSFQDLTGQRSNKVVRLVSYVEKRVASMMEILGVTEASGSAEKSSEENGLTSYQEGDTRDDAHLLHGPAMDGDAIEQGDVDAMFGTQGSDSNVADVAGEHVTGEDLSAEEASAQTAAEDEIADVEAVEAVEEPDSAPEADGEFSDIDAASAVEEASEPEPEPEPEPEMEALSPDDMPSAEDQVELHDAEVLTAPAEEALVDEATSKAPAPDILDVEPLTFDGPDMADANQMDADEADTEHEQSLARGPEDTSVSSMTDFTVDDQASDMFVETPDLSEAVDEADASTHAAHEAADEPAQGAQEAQEVTSSDAAAQDIFDVEDIDMVFEEPETAQGQGEAPEEASQDACEDSQVTEQLADTSEEAALDAEMEEVAASAEEAGEPADDTAEDAEGPAAGQTADGEASQGNELSDYTEEERIALFS